jgi:hypothetical protein
MGQKMKVAIFAIQYTLKKSFWSPKVPTEFYSNSRISLFNELIQCSQSKGIKLVVLPGGFFRTDSPGGIANALKHCPPKMHVLAGRDNVFGDQREVWIIKPSGLIRKIPEIWSRGWWNKTEAERQKEFNRIYDRRFQVKNKTYAVFGCGDIIIDDRLSPIADCKAAFVLAHYSSPGRSFTPAMRRLKKPIFLSHHVKHPYNTTYFAYKGDKLPLKPDYEFWNENSQGLEWIARVYSV